MDCGDAVSDWLSDALGREGTRLLRQKQEDGRLGKLKDAASLGKCCTVYTLRSYVISLFGQHNMIVLWAKISSESVANRVCVNIAKLTLFYRCAAPGRDFDSRNYFSHTTRINLYN